MRVPVSNPVADDAPDREEAAGFVGIDANTNPALLAPGLLADGENLYTKGDGVMETRPGTKVNSAFIRAWLNTYGAGSPTLTILAAGYYDISTYEATVFFTSNGPWAVTSHGNDVLATQIAPAPPVAAALANSPVIQLVDRIFYLDTFGRITWLLNTAGVWTSGTVILFSTGAAMPVWTRMAAHNFRLFVMEAEGVTLYASAVAAAAVAANWVPTENVRVGSGEGDPGRALISSQGRNLALLNGRSAWLIDTSEASVANWFTLQVSRLAGCVEGRTAVALGQDVFFLSRFGVVNLGALADTTSLSPQDTLSYPIQPLIDRINWSYISTAFATTWRDYYLLAVPLDSETLPTRFLPFHLKLKTWQPPWKFVGSVASSWPGRAGSPVWSGFTGALVTHFGDKSETMLIDDAGLLRRIDDTREDDEYLASVANTAGYPGTYADNSISAYLRTKNFVHGNPIARKQPFFAEVELKSCTASSEIYVYLLAEGQAQSTVSPNSADTGYLAQFQPSGVAAEKKRYLVRGSTKAGAAYRECALELYRTAKRMRVRAVALAAFVDHSFAS